MTEIGKLNELATIGRDFIGLQFRLTPDHVAHSIDHIWVLGYCVGVLDAVGQTAQLEDSAEELAVIALGLSLLMPEAAKGSELVQQALSQQQDPRFAQGSARGGTDMLTWLSDTSATPSGLSDCLMQA